MPFNFQNIIPVRFLQKIFVQTFNLETLKVAFILLFLFYREINSIFIPYRTENDNSNFLPILVSFILFVLFFLTLFDILKFKKWNLPLNYLPIGLIFLASFDFFIHEIEISEYFIFLVNCLGSFLSINLFLNLRNTSDFKINFLLFLLILVLTTKSFLNFFSGNLFFEGEKDYNYQIYSYTASLAAIILIQTLKKSYFSNNFILKVFIFFLIMSKLLSRLPNFAEQFLCCAKNILSPSMSILLKQSSLVLQGMAKVTRLR